MLFLIPIHILMLTIVITEINLNWQRIGVILSLGFILLNLNSFRYLFAENVYRSNREINPLINFLNERNDSIPVYLYRSSIPTFEYKTGFKAGLSGTPEFPFEKQNIIYGSHFYHFSFERPYSWKSIIEPDRVILNTDAIQIHPKVYLLISSCPKEHLQALLKPLKQTGSVTEVFRFKGTLLFLYNIGK